MAADLDIKAVSPHEASLANTNQDENNEANIDSSSRRANGSSQDHLNGSQERICDEDRASKSQYLVPDMKPWRSGDHYYHAIPKKEDPWEESFKLVLKFDDEMCRGWREEIDTLLVFAGLFSATVTAFTLVSYQQLQNDPDDIQIQLLTQIVSQLNSLQTGNATNAVTTQSPSITSNEAFVPQASSVRVNIFWFTSLTLSLTAVLVGSLCKQWLREYQRYEGLSPKEAFSVRQLHYEGLLGWHVPKILYSLPLLLQAALVLFFGGLLELLWNVNSRVASVVTAFVGIVMIFLAVTTALPCLQNLAHFSNLLLSHNREPQCAFKSPQSWAFHLLLTWIISLYSHVVQYFFYGTTINYLQLLSWHANDANWLKYDKRWQIHGKYIQRGFNWFDKTFIHGHGNIDAIYNIFYCLESLDIDIAAGCISQIIEENWNPLVPLVGLIQPILASLQNPQVTTDASQDVTRDLIMSSYLVVHHKADPYISLCCIERCTRVLNTSAVSNDLDSELAAVVLEMLNVIMPRAAVSEDSITQLATSLSMLFTSNSISSSEIPNFWLVFNHILQRAGDHSNNNTPPQATFRILLKAIEQWLLRTVESPTIPSRYKQSSVTSCTIGLSNIYWTPVKPPTPFIQSLQLETTTIDDRSLVSPAIDVQSVASLVRLLDRSLEVLGGSESLLSPWARETWTMMKDRFLDQPDLESDSPVFG